MGNLYSNFLHRTPPRECSKGVDWVTGGRTPLGCVPLRRGGIIRHMTPANSKSTVELQTRERVAQRWSVCNVNRSMLPKGLSNTEPLTASDATHLLGTPAPDNARSFETIIQPVGYKMSVFFTRFDEIWEWKRVCLLPQSENKVSWRNEPSVCVWRDVLQTLGKALCWIYEEHRIVYI
jgi:hypothetical protein